MDKCKSIYKFNLIKICYKDSSSQLVWFSHVIKIKNLSSCLQHAFEQSMNIKYCNNSPEYECSIKPRSVIVLIIVRLDYCDSSTGSIFIVTPSHNLCLNLIIFMAIIGYSYKVSQTNCPSSSAFLGTSTTTVYTLYVCFDSNVFLL